MSLAPCQVNNTPAPGERIRVRGLVQGVGFRPFVWRLANEFGLAGDVRNDSEGVLIHLWGSPALRHQFIHRLHRETPQLARIDALESEPLHTPNQHTDFQITASTHGDVHTGIVADAATCAQCYSEVVSSANRRHAYAFTNCTHCGPRLSIVRAIPYDRANTSMAQFALCPECRREYDDPADRRFHAQPNACSDCGPHVWLEGNESVAAELQIENWIDAVVRLLRQGKTVAIKGVGGIHLACDATNASAVARLRKRKHRPDKPLALMARDTTMIQRYCALTALESSLLCSPAAPIVLLDCHGPNVLPEVVAPKQHCYGFMLPYSPLHHLLMAQLDAPIVLTSGNRSNEPQCIDNTQARRGLTGIADALLLHNRDIVNRVDDSVVRIIAGAPAIIRRARGYAPTPLQLPKGFACAPDILAFGGELKSTFCLLKDGQAILSQHLGNLENAATNAAYRDTLALYQNLYQHEPEVLAIDSHPEYLPSKLGREQAEAGGTPLQIIQHHHAHIAACLADNQCSPDTTPVLGMALDGTGYGDDGTLWGGEFLLADYHGYQRLGSLTPVAMPGGAQAIHQPWRMAYAHLRRAGNWDALARKHACLSFFKAVQQKPLTTLNGMIESGFNSPLTSSCGRLFDAVAAVIGLCQTISYEGQAAIELEAAVHAPALVYDQGYPFIITHKNELPRVDPQPMWSALLQDLAGSVATGVIAARFHLGLAQAITQMVQHLAQQQNNTWGNRIALSGGVMQNSILTSLLIEQLESLGYQVLRHRHVPANDGGLSLGQAAIAAARTIELSNNPNYRSSLPCA